jgi:hypothetical protein
LKICFANVPGGVFYSGDVDKMKLFLQVAIGHLPAGDAAKPLLHFASSLSSDILGADLDNQSDPMIADLVVRMINRSASVFLLVEVHDPNLPLGSTQRVFDHLPAIADKLDRIVALGSHRGVDVLLLPFQSRLIREHDREQLKILIREFSEIN